MADEVKPYLLLVAVEGAEDIRFTYATEAEAVKFALEVVQGGGVGVTREGVTYFYPPHRIREVRVGKATE